LEFVKVFIALRDGAGGVTILLAARSACNEKSGVGPMKCIVGEERNTLLSTVFASLAFLI
jgi:hypothetical protein